MSPRTLHRGLLLAATMLVALTAAQPVFASTGTVGVYSYTDTAARPGAIGLYQYNAEDGFGWLKRFYVNPPKMRAVAGMDSQTVGWLYNVQRKICGFGGCGNWTVTYTSPEFTAITDDAHSPSWGQDSVRVRVPCGHNCADAGAVYRINIKMQWHRANGSIMGTAKHRIYYYSTQLDTGGSGVSEKVAPDSWSPDWE
ncbi:MAG: hypothetical protein ABIP53_06900 [Candidatus Limnocylindrales bacterium]